MRYVGLDAGPATTRYGQRFPDLLQLRLALGSRTAVRDVQSDGLPGAVRLPLGPRVEHDVPPEPAGQLHVIGTSSPCSTVRSPGATVKVVYDRRLSSARWRAIRHSGSTAAATRG